MLIFWQVRAYVEKQIDLIAKGKANKETIVGHVLNQFLQKFKFFVTNISKMDALFEASFSPLSATGLKYIKLRCPTIAGKLFGKCGKCKRYMKYIGSRPSRLYCPTCEDIYRLPQGGTIKQYKSLVREERHVRKMTFSFRNVHWMDLNWFCFLWVEQTAKPFHCVRSASPILLLKAFSK